MRIISVLAAVAAITAAPAFAETVDFEAGPFGGQAEGFSAVGHSNLKFFSANGNGLQTSNFGSQGDGNSLAVFSDADGNFLKGTFSGTTTSLALDFGNDDPNFTNPGDLATLTLFNGASLVSTVTVVLNRDDIMNQTISYSGSAFDNFSFAYTDAAGSPFTGGGGVNTGLIEIVDNITYGAVGGTIPEPASWAMMIAGFGLVGGALRRRATLVAA